jgi:transposase
LSAGPVDARCRLLLHRLIGNDMTTMTTRAPARQRGTKTRPDRVIYAGVDTKELHVAAVIDSGETVLGTRSFSTTRAGYRALLA